MACPSHQAFTPELAHESAVVVPRNDVVPLLASLNSDAIFSTAQRFIYAHCALEDGLGLPSAGHSAIDDMRSAFNKQFGPAIDALMLEERVPNINLSIQGIQDATRASKPLLTVSRHLTISEADNMIYRQSVILATIAVDHWLHSLVSEICAQGALLENRDTWFGQLYQRALCAVDRPAELALSAGDAGNIDFTASSQLPVTACKTYTMHVRDLSSYIPPAEDGGRSRHITSLLTSIIFSWFGTGAPSLETDVRYQAMSSLLRHFKNANIFLLPEVWAVYERPTGRLMKREYRKKQSFRHSDLRHFQRVLGEMVLPDEALSGLDIAVEKFSNRRQEDYLPSIPSNKRPTLQEQEVSNMDAAGSDTGGLLPVALPD
ncbi:hypothetical protein EV121DRAFT_274856, partial [Schizophyllum commune]